MKASYNGDEQRNTFLVDVEIRCVSVEASGCFLEDYRYHVEEALSTNYYYYYLATTTWNTYILSA